MRVFDFVFICEDVRRTQEWFETLVCLCFLFAAKGNLRASTQHVQQATCKLCFSLLQRKFKSIKLNMCNKLLANFMSALLKK
jgi:hypothetical protein